MYFIYIYNLIKLYIYIYRDIYVKIYVCVSYPFYSLVSATNIISTSASWTFSWRCFSSSDVFQDLRMSQVKEQQWFRVVFTCIYY